MTYSVVIPTLNEAHDLARTIAAARHALPAAEIVVVDGESRDATRAVARAAGAKVLVCEPGRGRQLLAGACSSTGDVIVFLHADTLLPPDAAWALEQALAEPACVGGAFSLGFADDQVPFVLRLLARGITLRSRLFRTATGDQAIFVRRTVLASIDWVPPVPLFEDVRLFQKMRRQGRVAILHPAVATSPRLWQKVGPLRLIMIHLVFRLLHSAGVSPYRLARWYPA